MLIKIHYILLSDLLKEYNKYINQLKKIKERNF